MIATKTTAMVVALAGVAILGVLATVGNQAAFAQVNQNNNNSQNQNANLTCNPFQDRGRDQKFTCIVTQEMGNCQVNVGANEDSTANSEFESEDCS